MNSRIDELSAKVDELIATTKLQNFLKKDDSPCKIIVMILAIIGAVAAVAGIAYAVYCFVTPEYEEDFDDDFDDDFFTDEDEI